jgi:SWI/SNF-related matrix-associated actin-dependent regulator of chromatin subfamily A member 5
MAKDESTRLGYMTKHAGALEPFIEDKVKMLLKANSQVVDNKKSTSPIVLGSQPDIVTTPLRDYQMIGLSWMLDMHSHGMPFILGDEMGLGKTLQTISLIAHLKESRGYVGPSLVVCPLSVLYSWCAEITKHAPTLKHFRFHSSDTEEREHQKHLIVHDILKYDIVVTTYEMIKNSQLLGLIRSTYFNLCVLDEGHVIKSQTTLVSEAARKIHCQTRVILTGTPLQNNLVELYAILNYLYPTYFTSPVKFEDAFDITHNRIDPDMLLKANKLLKVFMIRRLKCEVEKLMPKKIETKVIYDSLAVCIGAGSVIRVLFSQSLDCCP